MQHVYAVLINLYNSLSYAKSPPIQPLGMDYITHILNLAFLKHPLPLSIPFYKGLPFSKGHATGLSRLRRAHTLQNNPLEHFVHGGAVTSQSSFFNHVLIAGLGKHKNYDEFNSLKCQMETLHERLNSIK